MPPMEIKLSGTGHAYHPAQLAILSLQISSKASQTTQEADAAVLSSLNSLCDAITPFCRYDTATEEANNNAAIAHYTVSTRETAKGRERAHDNSMMSFSKTSSYNLTYTAHAELTITFRDFKLLARIATQTASMENTKITCLTWTLTPATQASIENEAGQNAARNALRKARNYAEVFAGLSPEESVTKVRMKEIKEGEAYKRVTRVRRREGGKVGMPTLKSEWDYEALDVGVEVGIEGTFVVDG